MNSQHLPWHVQRPLLDVVVVGDDATAKRAARTGHARQPLANEPARARLGARKRRAALGTQREEHALHRLVVSREQVPCERLGQLFLEPSGVSGGVECGRNVDVNLEVSRTDPHFDSIHLAASGIERAGNGRLARSEESKQPMLASRISCRNLADPRVLGGTWPEATKLPGRARQHNHYGWRGAQHQTGRGARQAKGLGSSGHCRLFTHSGLEVVVWKAKPLGDVARRSSDLAHQLLVDSQLEPSSPRQELDRSVIVRRPEPTRHDQQVGAQTVLERARQLRGIVTDDHNALRSQAEPCELAREEATVCVADVATNQLRSGQENVRTRLGAHAGGPSHV